MPKLHESGPVLDALTKCSKCGAPIFFAEHDQSGRPMPLSVKSHRKVPVPYVRDGKIQYRVMDVYDSHFADCPHANAFKGGDHA